MVLTKYLRDRTKGKRRPSVRFNLVHVEYHQPVDSTATVDDKDDMEEDDGTNTNEQWYSQEQLLHIRSTIRGLIYLMNAGYQETEAISFRGLESGSKTARVLKKQRRDIVQHILREEQEYRNTTGIHDPDRLAHLLSECTKMSQQDAFLLALQDTKAVYGNRVAKDGQIILPSCDKGKLTSKPFQKDIMKYSGRDKDRYRGIFVSLEPKRNCRTPSMCSRTHKHFLWIQNRFLKSQGRFKI